MFPYLFLLCMLDAAKMECECPLLTMSDNFIYKFECLLDWDYYCQPDQQFIIEDKKCKFLFVLSFPGAFPILL